ncbi:MAG: ABC transporter substrate-binding protein [Oscillospiraceae bacterium]|jgi:putative spermidine/putrescine transport system substrate-binding protein
MKKFKKLSAAALAVLMLFTATACGKDDEKSSAEGAKKWEGETLVVCSWGGAIQEAQKKTIFDKFEEEYGCTVIGETDPDPAKIKTMVDSENMEIDVWDVDSDFVPRGIEQGLFEKLDFDVISTEGLIENFITEYSVPAEVSTLCISWNTGSISNDSHPMTWAEFWDTDTYPGKRTLYQNPMSMFEAILLADGVSKDDMYPLDVDRVFDFLDAHKDDIVTFWGSGAESVELVAGGEAVLGSVWGGRVIAAQNDGQPIEKEINEAILAGDSWVIGKGSKNVEMAQDFIAFATSAAVIAEYAKEYPGNAPANTNAYDLMTDEEISKLASNPEKAETQLLIDVDWWYENYDDVYNRFQEWKLG